MTSTTSRPVVRTNSAHSATHVRSLRCWTPFLRSRGSAVSCAPGSTLCARIAVKRNMATFILVTSNARLSMKMLMEFTVAQVQIVSFPLLVFIIQREFCYLIGWKITSSNHWFPLKSFHNFWYLLSSCINLLYSFIVKYILKFFSPRSFFEICFLLLEILDEKWKKISYMTFKGKYVDQFLILEKNYAF